MARRTKVALHTATSSETSLDVTGRQPQRYITERPIPNKPSSKKKTRYEKSKELRVPEYGRRSNFALEFGVVEFRSFERVRTNYEQYFDRGGRDLFGARGTVTTHVLQPNSVFMVTPFQRRVRPNIILYVRFRS